MRLCSQELINASGDYFGYPVNSGYRKAKWGPQKSIGIGIGGS